MVGEEAHGELLKAAHDHFTAEGYTVNILHQEPGEEKSDAHLITDDGNRIHVEAESQTLSSPAKVLQNVKKAAAEQRDLVFVVVRGTGKKLANILEDPVNRRSAEHEDEDGTFSYYRLDGAPFTAIECIEDVDYTIYEHVDDGLQRFDLDAQAQCPELDNADAAELTGILCLPGSERRLL